VRTSEEIVAFIDEWIAGALDRPDLAASTPYSLEEKLAALDLLRRYAVKDHMSREEVIAGGYLKYSSDRFGPRSFMSDRAPLKQRTEQESKWFEDVAGFFREYLAAESSRTD
jgi:hypothetical protein